MSVHCSWWSYTSNNWMTSYNYTGLNMSFFYNIIICTYININPFIHRLSSNTIQRNYVYIHLTIYLSIYLSIYLLLCLYPSIWQLHIHLSIYLSFYLSIYSFSRLSTLSQIQRHFVYIHLSAYSSFYLSIFLSIYLSIYLLIQ